ncbi:hypothetical protein [Nocardia sp. BMG111209]|uniref:hypothetical protein n=1 Tax=Nocardia sp. BMG111209 TaxID=1160137 RepID=UPI0003699BFD|nr:hypothetical protein [Nocardia sp. BMG111209]
MTTPDEASSRHPQDASGPGPDTAAEHARPAEEPDVGFNLGAAEQDPIAQAQQLAHRIARELAALGPQGWRSMEAVFALTVAAEGGHVVFRDDGPGRVPVQPADTTLELVREHRRLSAQLGDGPWWRMLMSLAASGQIEVDYDYGDEPFPDDQVFPPDAYLADLQEFPRDTLPIWLAAHVGHADRQSRPPEEAAGQARADRAAGVRAVLSENDFPAFPVMWARWSVIAAAFVATGSVWGPRMLPALGWFEGARRSGSTLYALPGGRAVLSGGVWDAPELDAAYNDGTPLPRLYAGAPFWVANPVLNPRAARGMLSFCYWWEGGRWYRGESPGPGEMAAAVPGMWTAGTATDVVSGLATREPTAALRDTVATLVSAAEAGVVTPQTLADVFDPDTGFDLDRAYFQLTLAGVTTSAVEPIGREEAVELVRRHITDNGLDTSNYPLDRLRAERVTVGWMVFAPTEPEEIAIGRAIFYVADDGLLEHSSSSIAPSRYVEGFEQRYRERTEALR